VQANGVVTAIMQVTLYWGLHSVLFIGNANNQTSAPDNLFSEIIISTAQKTEKQE
jgi:hypothetical protein